jgi:signal peptide peptidase SppA
MDTRNLYLLTRSPLWAIKSEAVLEAISRISSVRAVGEWNAAKPSLQGKGTNKIAIIPIQGVLTKDGPSYYGANYDTITSALESAGADSSVKRVVLAVDSPGGEVTGLPETAGVLAAVAKIKPVSAIVEGTSASAAYWLTSQAHDITLTPSGEVGSVGVRMMHVDVSKMLEDMGYKITELHSGEFKTEWSPYKPLTEGAQADMQTRLDSTHQDFIGSVAGGRGARASAEITQARFGEGRMFGSAAAMTHGLVDKIQSAREFYRAIMPPQEETPAAGFPMRSRLNLERGRY